MARFAMVALFAVAGCSGDALGPGLGQPCSLFCAPGLSCSAMHFCEKSCHCDGDAGAAYCQPTSLSSGCPSTAACVATAATGEGMCATLCGGDAGCPSGEAACAVAPDGTRLCVGVDFPWQGHDAGIFDLSAASD